MYQSPSFFLRRIRKTPQSPIILELCLSKTWAGKSHDMIIVTSSFLKSFVFKMFALVRCLLDIEVSVLKQTNYTFVSQKRLVHMKSMNDL